MCSPGPRSDDEESSWIRRGRPLHPTPSRLQKHVDLRRRGRARILQDRLGHLSDAGEIDRDRRLWSESNEVDVVGRGGAGWRFVGF